MKEGLVFKVVRAECDPWKGNNMFFILGYKRLRITPITLFVIGVPFIDYPENWKVARETCRLLVFVSKNQSLHFWKQARSHSFSDY